MRGSTRFCGTAAGGFTLVEVLVVAVVTAVGLLGGLSLLLTGLRASRLAMQQTGAATLAADLGDRIRANHRAGQAYALGAGTVLAVPRSSARQAASATRLMSRHATCTSGSRLRSQPCRAR